MKTMQTKAILIFLLLATSGVAAPPSLFYLGSILGMYGTGGTAPDAAMSMDDYLQHDQDNNVGLITETTEGYDIACPITVGDNNNNSLPGNLVVIGEELRFFDNNILDNQRFRTRAGCSLVLIDCDVESLTTDPNIKTELRNSGELVAIGTDFDDMKIATEHDLPFVSNCSLTDCEMESKAHLPVLNLHNVTFDSSSTIRNSSSQVTLLVRIHGGNVPAVAANSHPVVFQIVN